MLGLTANCLSSYCNRDEGTFTDYKISARSQVNWTEPKTEAVGQPTGYRLIKPHWRPRIATARLRSFLTCKNHRRGRSDLDGRTIWPGSQRRSSGTSSPTLHSNRLTEPTTLAAEALAPAASQSTLPYHAAGKRPSRPKPSPRSRSLRRASPHPLRRRL